MGKGEMLGAGGVPKGPDLSWQLRKGLEKAI